MNDPQEEFLNLNLELFNGLFNEHSNLFRGNFFDVLKSAYHRTCLYFYTTVLKETLQNMDQLKLEAEKSSLNVDVYGGENILFETSTNIVFITAIHLKNWEFETDVKERMDQIEKQTDGKNAIQVLLVSKKIWEDRKKNTEEMTQYKRLRNYLRHEREAKISFIVLFWEELLELFEEREEVNPVYLSLKNMLETL